MSNDVRSVDDYSKLQAKRQNWGNDDSRSSQNMMSIGSESMCSSQVDSSMSMSEAASSSNRKREEEDGNNSPNHLPQQLP